MKVYGYCRISTKKQSLQRQVDNITKIYGNKVEIIKEEFTGTKLEGRKEFKKLLKKVEKGDKIIFDSVSRMSRNAEEGFELYKKLFESGIELEFIKEPHINTTVYKKALQNNIELTGTSVDFILEGINKYLLTLAEEQIKIAFNQAQKEVDDLKQRTKEGIQAKRKQAEAEGKEFNIGRKEGIKLQTKRGQQIKEGIKKYNKAFNGSLNDNECMKLLNTTRNTYYKYKKELLEGK